AGLEVRERLEGAPARRRRRLRSDEGDVTNQQTDRKEPDRSRTHGLPSLFDVTPTRHSMVPCRTHGRPAAAALRIRTHFANVDSRRQVDLALRRGSPRLVYLLRSLTAQVSVTGSSSPPCIRQMSAALRVGGCAGYEHCFESDE